MEFLDSLFYLNGEEIIVWGAGEYARAMVKNSLFFKNVHIAFFVDNDERRHGQHINKAEVKGPEEVTKYDYPIVIGSSYHHQEIQNQLLSMGVPKTRILDQLII